LVHIFSIGGIGFGGNAQSHAETSGDFDCAIEPFFR
jgi:hypothetical protein